MTTVYWFHTKLLPTFYNKIAPMVAYLGYGRHGTCHGHHFDELQKLLAKLKSLFTVLLTSILRRMHL